MLKVGPALNAYKSENQSLKEINAWLINKSRVLQSSLCVSLLRVSRLHFILKIQSKIDLGARIDPSNNSTPISTYMNQKIGFKSLEIHTLLKMEGNSSLNKGQLRNNSWIIFTCIWKPGETSPLCTKSPKSLVQSTCIFGAPRQALGRIAKRLLHERNKDSLIDPLLNEN